MSFQVPNTTPVPNEIINGWAKKLKGSELKVLLIVVRKTLGWVIDVETGMRKEEDWISYSQLMEATGLTSQPLSAAIDSLCGKYKLVQIRDEDGNVLDTANKRRTAGRRRLKLLYRLNLSTLEKTSHYFENQSTTTLKTKVPLLRKSKTTKTTITKTTNTKDIYSLIFDCWNEQGIVKHKNLSEKMKSKINGFIKDEGYKESEREEAANILCQSIRNYAKILSDDQYYWSHKWTLEEFIARGAKRFMDWEIASTNYLKNKTGFNNQNEKFEEQDYRGGKYGNRIK